MYSQPRVDSMHKLPSRPDRWSLASHAVDDDETTISAGDSAGVFAVRGIEIACGRLDTVTSGFGQLETLIAQKETRHSGGSCTGLRCSLFLRDDLKRSASPMLLKGYGFTTNFSAVT